MWQEAAALRDFNPTFVRFGSNASHRRARDVPTMSASHPITTELVRHNEPALRANSDLTHCSKKDCYSITLSARSTRAGGNFMAHRFCGLQIGDQLELSLLFGPRIVRRLVS